MRRALVLLVAALVLVAPESAAIAIGAPDPGDVKPQIVWKKIPFGAARKRQMARYSKRHYGERTYELHGSPGRGRALHGRDVVRLRVEPLRGQRHAPGREAGVCAHFLIDTDGTIYQLVNLRIRCRHAIGMNWTAIGIEHVGTSADEILGDRDMMRASLRLTVWLMARYGISWGNVIGHAETLQSPFHEELYDDWRCMTHADFNRGEMRIFRRRLRRVAGRLDVPIGAGPHWVDSGC